MAQKNECRYARAYDVQFRELKEDLVELKLRVNRLEEMLARGVLLLTANLVGVVMSLARQLF